MDTDGPWWDAFYANRVKPCPFFVPHPDESLAQWLAQGLVPAGGRALDIGCGHGRNAVYLARHGFQVDAVDFSGSAIAWARERAAQAGVDIAFTQANIFDVAPAAAQYDLVYDSGCFHHMAPHQREPYAKLVANALKPGGIFCLTTFRPEGGSGYTDDEVYERGSLGGGLGYSEEQLRRMWSGELEILELRQMAAQAPDSGLFGADFLWVMRACKP